MKRFNKLRFLPLLLPLLMIVLIVMPIISMAAQQPAVNLGTTVNYAVLAGSTITNTGPTTINGSSPEGGGNVGLFPGTSFTGQANVTMTGWVADIANAAASLAKDDLQNAYNDAAGRSPVTRIATELGGSILTPGTYDSASGTFGITGTLTLDAQGDPNAVFVFKTDSTLNTASNSNILLLNGARFCRIFWKVGSSATLGSNSHFVGHIFAQISITANTRATVQGQLLALTGAVTLDTNTITNGLCAQIESTTAEDTTSESTTAESTTSESTTAESTTSEIATAESTTSESTTAESTTSESTAAESTTSESTAAESTTSESTTAESTTSESTAAESTTSESTTAEGTTNENTATESTTDFSGMTEETSTTRAISDTESTTTLKNTSTEITEKSIPNTGNNSTTMVALLLTLTLISAGTGYAVRKKSN